ncbi:two-component regulator propeller domain-containing protein [Desulfosediminicola flagellatus]|uniref:two-component regulator propeller domain-containing protein n=1 Tax=Desulfosediminicola flagellatus TaxID=2569541 RepID=UPI0010ACE1DA|nr:two-component regulator propeller domain-containing protein [Desulfosediminicola flagellatus]
MSHQFHEKSSFWKYFFLLVLLIIAFQGISVSAVETNEITSRQLHFSQIGEPQGLHKRTITCGLQDQRGFLWFGSEDGLIRYDGYSFKEFLYNSEDPYSLSSNLVYALEVDRHGTLWIGTVGGGLNKYDASTDRFIRYLNDPEDPKSLSHNGVVAIMEDSNGYLWIGTEGGGLNRLDPDRNEFTRFQHNMTVPESLANDSVWHLYQDSKERIWVGTFGGGLDLFMPDNENFTHYRSRDDDPDTLSSDIIGAIYEDSQGRMWIGSTDAGLNRFDPETGRSVRYKPDADVANTIGHSHVWSIYEDEDGLIWIGSFGGGVILFDPSKEQFSSVLHNPSVPSSLSNNFVWFIFESRDGVLWVGTDGGGLNKLVRRNMLFNHLISDPKKTEGLRYNGITGVAEGTDGLLWLANDGGGFQYLNPTSGDSQIFQHEPGNPDSLASDLAEAILVDSLGVVWVGTYKGLSAYNPKSGTFKTYLNDPANPNSLSDNRIWGLLEDHQGYLWVGTRNGLNRLSPDRKTINRFFYSHENPQSLSDNGVWTVFEDSRKNIWVGTDHGLNRLLADSSNFEHYFAIPGDNTSLSHNNITVIYEDRESNLWIGTNGGLNYLKAGGNVFSQYTSRDGMISNSIRGILEDDDGSLWITTVKGLSHFSPKNKTCDNFDKSDGLQGSEFSRAHLRTHDGLIVIGGRNGINIFNPSRIERNTYVPPVILTAIKQQNRHIHPDDPQNQKGLHLKYTENSISFEFAALDYTNPQKNNYAYILEGFDRDWTEAGNQRNATYTNLDGGKYTFRVKGSNNHNLWNEDGVRINLVVTDPPWLRWWAYLLYLLIVTGSVFGLMGYKAYQHKRRMVAIQKINMELEKEVLERVKAEEALHISEQRLSMAVDAAQQGIWEFFPVAGKTYFSPAWFTMLGYEPDEFPHTYETWSNLLHPEDQPCIKLYIAQFLADSADSFNIEFRMRAKDGRYRWIQGIGKTFKRDHNGNIVHMTGLHIDVTDQKEWVNKLESSERRYRELFNEAPVMYVIVEDRDGEAWIRDANKTFIATLGYEQDDVLNTPLSRYYAPDTRSTIYKNGNYEKIAQRTFLPEEQILVTRNGQIVHTLLHASPEETEDGKVTGIRAMFLDITSKKQAEKEAQRLEAALHQSRKMEAIGTLAGGIAHDFNNILAAILGYCDLLMIEVPADSPVHHKLKQINLAGLRARDLVQQILTFSRQNERRLEPLNVAPLIKEALKLLRSTLPVSIEIVTNIQPDVPNIIADPTQVHQIIMNLCTNSAQAMPEGGKITITLDKMHLTTNDSRRLPHQHPGVYLSLVIEDSGQGIPEEHLHNIFTPYFTTKSKAKGTGLGLAVVHGIVQHYGGSITVQSKLNQGTSFHIRIPATVTEPLSEGGEVVVPAGDMEHILFVDDEPMLVDIGKNLLGSLGYQVTATTSCNEAILLFKENPQSYDLLISDITMPEMSGEKLAEQIKAIRADLPVLLLTGFSDKLQGQTPETLGVEGLMYKPVEKNRLAESIYNLLKT